MKPDFYWHGQAEVDVLDEQLEGRETKSLIGRLGHQESCGRVWGR